MTTHHLYRQECVRLYTPFTGLDGVIPEVSIGGTAWATMTLDGSYTDPGYPGAQWYFVVLAGPDRVSPPSGSVVVTATSRVFYSAATAQERDIKPDKITDADWVLLQRTAVA